MFFTTPQIQNCCVCVCVCRGNVEEKAQNGLKTWLGPQLPGGIEQNPDISIYGVFFRTSLPPIFLIYKLGEPWNY